MSVKAIDNANMIGLTTRNVAWDTFAPAVTYVYDPAAGTIVVTDASVIPAGDTLNRVHIKIMDDFGGELRDSITVTGAPGAKTINVTSLNRSKPLTIVATVVTTNNLVSDGTAHKFYHTSGALGSWDKKY